MSIRFKEYSVGCCDFAALPNSLMAQFNRLNLFFVITCESVKKLTSDIFIQPPFLNIKTNIQINPRC